MKSEIIVTLISGGFVAIGIYLWQKGNHLVRYGKRALATVIDNHEETRRGITYYYPIVKFTTDDQQEVSHQLAIGSTSPTEKGTVFTIVYDPDDPTTVSIDSRTMLEFVPRILVVTGLYGLVLVLFEVFGLTAVMP